MAYANSTTGGFRPHLGRINPTWTPATEPLGPLAPFFRRRKGGATHPASRPLPVRPSPAFEVA